MGAIYVYFNLLIKSLHYTLLEKSFPHLRTLTLRLTVSRYDSLNLISLYCSATSLQHLRNSPSDILLQGTCTSNQYSCGKSKRIITLRATCICHTWRSNIHIHVSNTNVHIHIHVSNTNVHVHVHALYGSTKYITLCWLYEQLWLSVCH